MDDNSDCTENTISSVAYTTCTHPIVLTDLQLGPGQYDAGNSDTYYLWDKNTANQILFTFATPVSVSILQLHYYADRANGIALPKSRLSLVNASFNISDTLDDDIVSSFTIGPIEASEGENMLQNFTRQLTEPFRANTTQILLRIEDDKDYALALSEIKFCTGENICMYTPYTMLQYPCRIGREGGREGDEAFSQEEMK